VQVWQVPSFEKPVKLSWLQVTLASTRNESVQVSARGRPTRTTCSPQGTLSAVGTAPICPLDKVVSESIDSGTRKVVSYTLLQRSHGKL